MARKKTFGEDTKCIQIRVPVQVLNILNNEARNTMLSVASIVRRIILTYYTEKGIYKDGKDAVSPPSK